MNERENILHRLGTNLDKVVCVLLAVVFFYSQAHLVMLYAFGKQISIKTVVISLVLFKLGEQMHVFFQGLSREFWILTSLVLITAVFLYPGTPLLYLVYSFSIMNIRDAYRKPSLRVYKLIGRAIGFMLSPFSSQLFLPFLPILLGLCWIDRKNIEIDKNIKMFTISSFKNIGTYLLMLLHHCHYFTYAYSIPVIYSIKTSLKRPFAGIMFFVGWIAYNAYEKYLKPNRLNFVIGHAILSASLFLLYFSSSITSITFLWFLTGLGGGTVYMLKHSIPQINTGNVKDLRIFEGFGHVLGLLIWGIAIIHFKAECTFIIAGVVGCIVIAVTSMLHLKKIGYQ